MTTAMGICELGMINDMRLLDMIGHNLANANTAGFKRDMAVFRSFDAIITEELGAASPVSSQAGHAKVVPPIRQLIDHSAGMHTYTGNPLDMVIEGDGYFELRGPEGVRYARHGSFSVDEGGRLVNRHGLRVGAAEGEILLHGGDVTVSPDGNVEEDGVYAGQLALVRIKDPAALIRQPGGLWSLPAGIMADPAEGAQLRQGYVESSNVRAMDEMVQMMTTLRHFETTASVIKGYDEMMNTAISTIAEF